MIDLNELRKVARDCYWPTSPVPINKLLDRLEAAESDGLEQARLNGMGGEREAALLARLEAAEKERDELRARIEEMERQEPVVEVGQQYSLLFVGSGSITEIVERHGLKVGSKLYTLPSAQPATSVPMDVIADYLVSISAHLARRDDAKAQAEIVELLKMIAKAPKPDGE